MVVLGGEFMLLLFIGVMAAGCWSELRGDCFWEVYDVATSSMLKSIRTFGLVAPPRGWLLF